MRRFKLSFAAFGAMFVLGLYSSPASAQATGTWVSGVGDDVNPCSRTAPCKTFSGAISKTAINGEIRCLDPGGFGGLTITKSISVDCHEIPAFSLHANGTCFTINLNLGTTADPLQTVRLRNITCNGTGTTVCSGVTCGIRAGVRGINIVSANQVFIEDMIIQGNVNEGIRDARTTAGNLYIKNTTVRDNAGNGIAVVSAGGVAAVIENSQSLRNANGIATGNLNKVMASNSVFSGNTNGVQSDSGGQVSVDKSTISSNATGVMANAGSTIRLSDNNIAFNTTGISGATTSFGNNRIYPTVGTAPTAAGAPSSSLGTQ